MKKYTLIIRTNSDDEWIGLDLQENLNVIGDSCSDFKEIFSCGGDLKDKAKHHNEMSREIKRRKIHCSEFDVINKC